MCRRFLLPQCKHVRNWSDLPFGFVLPHWCVGTYAVYSWILLSHYGRIDTDDLPTRLLLPLKQFDRAAALPIGFILPSGKRHNRHNMHCWNLLPDDRRIVAHAVPTGCILRVGKYVIIHAMPWWRILSRRWNYHTSTLSSGVPLPSWLSKLHGMPRGVPLPSECSHTNCLSCGFRLRRRRVVADNLHGRQLLPRGRRSRLHLSCRVLLPRRRVGTHYLHLWLVLRRRCVDANCLYGGQLLPSRRRSTLDLHLRIILPSGCHSTYRLPQWVILSVWRVRAHRVSRWLLRPNDRRVISHAMPSRYTLWIRQHVVLHTMPARVPLSLCWHDNGNTLPAGVLLPGRYYQPGIIPLPAWVRMPRQFWCPTTVSPQHHCGRWRILLRPMLPRHIRCHPRCNVLHPMRQQHRSRNLRPAIHYVARLPHGGLGLPCQYCRRRCKHEHCAH